MSTSETSVTEDSKPSTGTVFRGIVKTLRPHQWIKNLFVLAPLFFSKTFIIPAKLGKGFAAAFLFCLAAGTVYLFNDILDIEKDRKHPVKRNRPIPSGDLPIRVAWAARLPSASPLVAPFC